MRVGVYLFIDMVQKSQHLVGVIIMNLNKTRKVWIATSIDQPNQFGVT